MALACGGHAPEAKPKARNAVLITIDTLRADHVGAYGYQRAATPALDSIAAAGTRFDSAYAAAPITLPSHATLLSGRYPPGHGARDNGMPVSSTVPTLATVLKARGFRTAAFVAAFPLDHQFGLNRGFDVYSDRMPRGNDGRLQNERAASAVVEEAIAWLGNTQPSALSPQPTASPQPFFLWVHLFEPHAPYGDPLTGRSTIDRYDEEIATADRAVARLLAALAPALPSTLVVAAGDHGEAFGEHGEYAHSIFVYDTTLRVPLVMRGPGVAQRAVDDPVTLADVAPTVAKLLGGSMADVDGVDLSARPGATREIYAESFAPLVEFGWAPLRSVRSGQWKFIAAPTVELYDIKDDAAERSNVASGQPTVTELLDKRVARYSAVSMPSLAAGLSPESAERLRSLGYVGSGSSSGSALSSQPSALPGRPDPKDRRELAGRLAQVTAGELSGAALVSALEAIVREDPRNGQAHLRLGYARLEAGDCAHAEPELRAAIATGLPTADAHLGLATCLGRHRDLDGAEKALADAQRLEPDNPVIIANVGILQASKGNAPAAIDAFTRALAKDPDLHEARFNLAVAYAKAGRRADAVAAARELLARLPPSAPQRPEVERLLRAVQ